MSSPEIFFATGEVSGDLHGAAVLDALREHCPDLRARGIGGEHLSRSGMELVAGIEQLSLVGVAEVLPRLGSILRLFRTVRRELKRRPPLAAVLIDSPDFNLRVAAIAGKLGIKVIYYIGPTLWAWRKGRIKTVRRHVDLMLTILPFEERLYTSQGVRARFVGHPLADVRTTGEDTASFLSTLGLTSAGTFVALLPGSRRNEIRRHLPVLLETAERLHRQRDNLHFLIPAASGEALTLIRETVGSGAPWLTVTDGRADLCLSVSRAAVVTSGTATLEAALLGTPFVTIYRLTLPSYLLGRVMVKTPHISLPNILDGSEVVREFIQGDCRPTALAAAIGDLLDDEGLRDNMISRFDKIRRSLAGGADREAAAAIAAETGLDRTP